MGLKDGIIIINGVVRNIAAKLKRITSYVDVGLVFLDLVIPKRKDYWIFPVYFIGKGEFADNNLAVFEMVKNDQEIKKIILTREVGLEIRGNNVLNIPMNSFKAAWYIIRSKIIFVQHSVWLDLAKSKYQIRFPFRRNIINLWHGLAIKDISHQNTEIINKRSLREMPKYKIICSSEIDKKNMQKAFYKTDKNDFWITGIPRNDFLFMEEDKLPDAYKTDITNLRALLKGKKLILYAPTYREINVGGLYYDFSEKELDVLEEFLVQNNCIFGLRYHIYRKPTFYRRYLKRKNIINLSEEIIADVRMIIREADLIVTDYSSLYADALLLGKKSISFAYDYDHYLKTQRGFFYDFESIFSGEICRDFNSLLKALSNISIPCNISGEINKIKLIQSSLFKYLDEKNSQRVVERVKML